MLSLTFGPPLPHSVTLATPPAQSVRAVRRRRRGCWLWPGAALPERQLPSCSEGRASRAWPSADLTRNDPGLRPAFSGHQPAGEGTPSHTPWILGFLSWGSPPAPAVPEGGRRMGVWVSRGLARSQPLSGAAQCGGLVGVLCSPAQALTLSLRPRPRGWLFLPRLVLWDSGLRTCACGPTASPG